MEKSESPQVTACDMIDIDKLIISTHALGRFSLRSNLTLVEAAETLRARLSNSVPIKKHDKLRLEPHGKRLFFQNAQDKDTIYVVKATSKKRGYYLATVLRPLEPDGFKENESGK